MKQGVKQTIKTDRAYALTLTVEKWVDVFTRKNHRDALIESLRYCQKHKGLIVYAYCIMSNHVHLIAATHEPFLLEETIRDFKKFTSKKIIEQLHAEPESRSEWMLPMFASSAKPSTKHTFYKFWKTGNHAIELYNEKFTWDKINYIHNNPVKAGLVREPQDWIYSSATNYFGLESVLDVEIVSPRLITVR